MKFKITISCRKYRPVLSNNAQWTYPEGGSSANSWIAVYLISNTHQIMDNAQRNIPSFKAGCTPKLLTTSKRQQIIWLLLCLSQDITELRWPLQIHTLVANQPIIVFKGVLLQVHIKNTILSMSQLLCFDIDNMWRKVFHMGRMWLEYINKVPIILSVASRAWLSNRL
jgi:hypothetical protein